MPTATLRASRSVAVRVTNQGGILRPVQTSTPTVQTTAIVGVDGTAGRFDQLLDVVEGSPSEGAIPQYDADTDKYVVGQLAEVDGGTF